MEIDMDTLFFSCCPGCRSDTAGGEEDVPRPVANVPRLQPVDGQVGPTDAYHRLYARSDPACWADAQGVQQAVQWRGSSPVHLSWLSTFRICLARFQEIILGQAWSSEDLTKKNLGSLLVRDFLQAGCPSCHQTNIVAW